MPLPYADAETNPPKSAAQEARSRCHADHGNVHDMAAGWWFATGIGLVNAYHPVDAVAWRSLAFAACRCKKPPGEPGGFF
jgi:hypothetical protein